MKLSKLFIPIFLLFIITAKSTSQDYHVRIAFIGNSITVANAPLNTYPSQFANMMSEIYGDTCIVRNYAVSGRTMLKKGDFPIWNEDSFTYCLQSAPDILFILLGTNDSKPYNWDDYGDEFYTDYMSMIDTFKLRNPRTKFIVSAPPPAFQVVFDIRDSVILNGVIPLVDSIASETGADLVDFYNPLLDSVSLFPDYIHPNVRGSKAMADIVYEKFMETDIVHTVELGYTYVTRLESNKKYVAENDSVIVSWMTINADTAYLNGLQVPINGSMKVSSGVPTSYTVSAKGVYNIDSVTIEQEFYHPVISRLVLNPGVVDIYEGDTAELILTFKDQHMKPIGNDSTAVTWSITEGEGSLINEDYTSALYIAGDVGNAKVSAQIRDISDESVIRINSPSANLDYSRLGATIFPNPANDKLQITGIDFNYLELLDLNGKLVFSTNTPVHYINTGKIENGVYFLKLFTEKEILTEKIIINHK